MFFFFYIFVTFSRASLAINEVDLLHKVTINSSNKLFSIYSMRDNDINTCVVLREQDEPTFLMASFDSKYQITLIKLAIEVFSSSENCHLGLCIDEKKIVNSSRKNLLWKEKYEANKLVKFKNDFSLGLHFTTRTMHVLLYSSCASTLHVCTFQIFGTQSLILYHKEVYQNKIKVDRSLATDPSKILNSNMIITNCGNKCWWSVDLVSEWIISKAFVQVEAETEKLNSDMSVWVGDDTKSPGKKNKNNIECRATDKALSLNSSESSVKWIGGECPTELSYQFVTLIVTVDNIYIRDVEVWRTTEDTRIWIGGMIAFQGTEINNKEYKRIKKKYINVLTCDVSLPMVKPWWMLDLKSNYHIRKVLVDFKTYIQDKDDKKEKEEKVDVRVGVHLLISFDMNRDLTRYKNLNETKCGSYGGYKDIMLGGACDESTTNRYVIVISMSSEVIGLSVCQVIVDGMTEEDYKDEDEDKKEDNDKAIRVRRKKVKEKRKRSRLPLSVLIRDFLDIDGVILFLLALIVFMSFFGIIWHFIIVAVKETRALNKLNSPSSQQES